MVNLVRIGAVVGSAVMALPAAGPAVAAAPAPADATAVTGPCRGGPGNMTLSVATNPDGSHHVDVVGRRMVEDSAWRIKVFLQDEAGEEESVLRARVEDGGWRVSTDTRVSVGSWAGFHVAAVRTDQDGRDTLCLLATEPGRSAFGATFCGRGFNLLDTRRRADGSTVLRYRLYGARDMRWRITAKVTDGPDDVRSVTVDDVADRRGRAAARIEMTGLDSPRYSFRAVNERGAVCWLRLDPSDVASDPGGSSRPTRRELLHSARR